MNPSSNGFSHPAPRPSRRTPDWLLFFSKFLRYGTAISSVAPSSRYLARAMVRDIDFARARCVVELGAGTGPVTAELVRRVQPPRHLLIVERDPDFCQRLRERFPGADVAQADAVELDRLLAERGLGGVDHVLSGLPLAMLRRADLDHLLGTVRRHLHPEGTFRQITEIPWLYYPLHARYFARVQFRFVLRNFPPGGIYICRDPLDPNAGRAQRASVAGSGERGAPAP